MTNREESGAAPLPTMELLVLNPGSMMLARSILEAADIRYVARNDATQSMIGGGQVGMGYNSVVGPPSIVVEPDSLEEARRLLASLCESGDASWKVVSRETEEESAAVDATWLNVTVVVSAVIVARAASVGWLASAAIVAVAVLSLVIGHVVVSGAGKSTVAAMGRIAGALWLDFAVLVGAVLFAQLASAGWKGSVGIVVVAAVALVIAHLMEVRGK